MSDFIIRPAGAFQATLAPIYLTRVEWSCLSMRLNVALSNDESDVDPGPIVAQARLAEELGYSGVWVPDHLLPPEPYGDVYGGVYEALMLLSHVAAVTNRVTLG